MMCGCYFPRSCCSLLILGFAKPNGEPTDDWLFFPSPFPQYHPKVQPKGAPSPPHSTIFPHFVPLEAEEVNQSFALDFLQNQQNQPNDPQTEVPMPTPNLTNSWDQPVGGKELQELKPSWETPLRAWIILAHLRQKSKPNQAFVIKKKPKKVPKTLFLCWV